MFNVNGSPAKVLKVSVVIIMAVAMNQFPVCDSWAQMAPPASGGTSGSEMPVEEAGGVLPASGNVTVNFKDVDIKTVLHYLSEVSGVDIIPSPGPRRWVW